MRVDFLRTLEWIGNKGIHISGQYTHSGYSYIVNLHLSVTTSNIALILSIDGQHEQTHTYTDTSKKIEYILTDRIIDE